MNKLQKIAISLIPLSGLMAAETAMAVGKLAAPFGAGLVVLVLLMESVNLLLQQQKQLRDNLKLQMISEVRLIYLYFYLKVLRL